MAKSMCQSKRERAFFQNRGNFFTKPLKSQCHKCQDRRVVSKTEETLPECQVTLKGERSFFPGQSTLVPVPQMPGQESSFKDRRDFARMPSDSKSKRAFFQNRGIFFTKPLKSQ